ncbi:MAG: AAA family ATPase [Chlamydiae bacterium]|nr:AAA family ATPase [Chlamydiota bacterium]MBI3276759.1 AAA family ATPase [Chlamydiota bacterium]
MRKLYRKFKIFFMNHWVAFLVTFLTILLIALSIWGLYSLESFYRNMTLASLPIQLLMVALNAVIFVYIYAATFRGGFSQMKKEKVKANEVNVHFDEVIGIDEAKEEAWEVVQLIKDRTKLKQIGGKILRGLLMIGPPGCGKTLLAKAIATEAGLPFLSISGSEFVEVFVGVGASRVRKLFQKAKKLAYAHGGCIIFIDEMDAIGRKRHFFAMGGGQETDSTLNQLLVELDGLSGAGNIVVLGATNAVEGVMDEALLRPGRFDRKIYISKPGLAGREKLFKFYLDKVKYDPTMDVPRLSRRSVGLSPAEVESLIKEAALIATRDKREVVTYKDMTSAMERLYLGVKIKRDVPPIEKMETAYHEAGHLIVLYILHPTDDVFKASIANRKDTLGVVYPMPREDLRSHDRNKVLADIKVSLGGYAAEKIKFGATTTGVSGDFRNAMHIAHRMVWEIGMGKKGYVGDYTVIPESQLADQMKIELNQDVKNIMDDCLKEVEDLLKSEMNLLDRFANELIQKEELEYDEIEAIFKEFGKDQGLAAKEQRYAPQNPI